MSLWVRHIPLFLALTSFLLSPGTALAQKQKLQERSPDEPTNDDGWVSEAEVLCKNEGGISVKAYVDDRDFRLCLKVDLKQLRPRSDGQPNATPFTILSFTKRTGRNLDKVEGLATQDPGNYPGLSIDPPQVAGGEEKIGQWNSVREFGSKLHVEKVAKSYPYSIAGTITCGDAQTKVSFDLPIASGEEGALEVRNSQQSMDCWTGSDCSPLKLNMRNRLPYRLQNGQVTVSKSEPSDLVTNQVTMDHVDMAADKLAPINLRLHAQGISLPRIFSGFGKSPEVTLTVQFEDEYGRLYSTDVTVFPQIRPNVLVLTIFLLLGVVFGTVIRIDLRRLQKAGLITKRQQWIFAATTFGSGILVCLIALFANLKIVVLDDQNSYSAWDPKVLFLTALVGTIGGIPILYGFLKLPKQLEASPGAGPDPKPAPAPDDDRGHGRRHVSKKRSR
jgi:hypothetical protein